MAHCPHPTNPRPPTTPSRVEPNNGRYFYHPDLVTRNINMITDSTGNTVATYTYDPYGNNTATGSYAATNVMRYQASQQDNTGLYKFGDRYYDPTTQHWTQQDTLAGNFNNPTSTNHYTYAGSNPEASSDQKGRNAFSYFFSQTIPDAFGGTCAGSFAVASTAIGVGVGIAFTGLGAIVGGAVISIGGAIITGETC